MDITLADCRNEVTVVHRLTNKGRQAITLAPWSLQRGVKACRTEADIDKYVAPLAKR